MKARPIPIQYVKHMHAECYIQCERNDEIGDNFSQHDWYEMVMSTFVYDKLQNVNHILE